MPASVVAARAPSVGARPDDRVVVLGIVAVLALPILLAGPELVADDWVWVRNGEFLGWWDAGGSRQVGRPGAFALYAVTFGLFGAHPLVHAGVQVALWAVAGVSVYAALFEIVDRQVARWVTVLWLLAPSHTALELWASTSQAWVAIALLAIGGRQIARAGRGEAASWMGFAALGAAGAFYEVAILAAPVVAIAADWAVRGRWSPRTALLGVLSIVPAAGWSLATTTVYSSEVRTTEDEWLRHLAGSVGMGVRVDQAAVAAMAVVLWLAALVPAARRSLRGQAGRLDGLAIAGAALVVAGTLPALRAYTIPVGMGDRLTAVSGLGAAMSWTGALAPVVQRLSQTMRRGVAVAFGLFVVIMRVDSFVAWERVGDDGLATARSIAAEIDGPIVVEGPLAEDGFWYGLSDGWNTTAAVQVLTGDASNVVQVDVGCIRSGPLPDRPLEQYGRRSELRVPACQR